MLKAMRGSVPPYGIAISDALKDPKTTLDELIAHRDHGRAALKQQGDLEAALKKLEAEIQRRGGK